MQTHTTLTQYLLEQEHACNLIAADLRRLIEGVARACKMISYQVNRGALNDVLGSAERKNVQGEVQKKLDLIANDILFETNQWGGYLAAMASEELEHIYPIPPRYAQGEYLLLLDPLDGSSNIDVNVSIGTIFSVLRHTAKTPPTEQAFLQAGARQVAAGYAIYGPQTMFTLTLGRGVACFTLDQTIGEWVLTHNNLCIPRQSCEFAVNASNARHWYPPVQRYIDELLAGEDGVRRQNFNMRWTASMVADVHRILNRGGIFMYPADKRNPAQAGKLRLMYEAGPMAFIVEQAQGAATNGAQRILELVPTRLHQRVPVFLGSKEEVERVTRYHQA